MNASDIMTTPALTLPQHASLADAIRLMLGRHISGVPVVDGDGRLVGILTEGDLLRRIEVGTADHHWSGLRKFLRGPGLNAEEYVHAHSRRVADLMTPAPVSVAESTPLDEVVDILERKRIRRVPVVADERVVGVVSRADILRAVGNVVGAPAETDADDAAVLARLHAELDRQPWFTERNLQLSVHHGTVRMEGFVTDPRMRDALRVAAQNTSGRAHVQDELEVVDPASGMAFSG